MIRLVQWTLLASLLGIAPLAYAGQWAIGSGSAYPGGTISMAIWFAGDGLTADASIDVLFDEARLALPVSSGNIPGAPLVSGAYCVRVGANRVRVLKVSSSGEPAPSTWTQICQITFAVPTNAMPGTSPLTGTSAECAGTSGSQPCSIYHGQSTVFGTSDYSIFSEAPDSTVLALLSSDSGAPSPEMLQSIDFRGAATRSPLESLDQVRPRKVSALVYPRAQGELAELLREHTRTPRAVLERYVVVSYEDADTARRGLAALRGDRWIEYATDVPHVGSTEIPDSKLLGPAELPDAKNTFFQSHLTALNLPSAWQMASGWSLVGIIDSGLQVSHPSLRSFSGLSYTSGNYLPVYSVDYSVPGAPEANVDEKQPVPVSQGAHALCIVPASDPICASNPTTSGADCMVPKYVGHGTHTAGLIAANSVGDASAFAGTCRNCGLAVTKIATATCKKVAPLEWAAVASFNIAAVPPAMTWLATTGSQVVSFSGTVAAAGYCESKPDPSLDAWCAAMALAAANDIVVVAASGNSRSEVVFPASDARAVSVGGVSGDAIWDESPGTFTNCPYYNASNPDAADKGYECGTNYTINSSLSRQEVVAPARRIWSTMYTGADYSPKIGCGDSYGGAVTGAVAGSDGIGQCTGTSMSTPMVSGIIGLLRSINPLVRAGSPVQPLAYGVRNVLVESTNRAGLPWDPKFGYGQPDARKAAERMLGKVRGDIVANRVTPLFSLYSAGAQDFLSVASPQAAVAFMRFAQAPYTTTPSSPIPQGSPTPSYTSFPTEIALAPPPPRANAYVLTTENPPLSGLPTPVPLYWLDRPQALPGYPMHRDSLLVASVAHAEFAAAQGYALRGIQGYVYPPCPQDACMPVGTQRLYRQCNTAIDDCAIFLESELGAYVGLGYTTAFPPGSNTVLGYAYPVVDSDGDGLVNGMEHIIGTAINDADSDDDGVADGIEFPQTGISMSDPCTETPSISCSRPRNTLFINNFE